MPVVDIRGTNGSGKSWIVHQLLEKYNHRSVVEDQRGPNATTLGYVLEPDVGVVGKYANVCGGCDGVGSADEVVRRVRLFAAKYRVVLLEGLLVSHTFKRYSALATELEALGQTYYFCFLNTPLKTCIGRVRKRRKERGDDRPLNPANLIKDWHCIWEATRKKCIAAGHNVVILNHRDPLPQIERLLHGS